MYLALFSIYDNTATLKTQVLDALVFRLENNGIWCQCILSFIFWYFILLNGKININTIWKRGMKASGLTFGNGNPMVSLTDSQQLLSYSGAEDFEHKISVSLVGLSNAERESFSFWLYNRFCSKERLTVSCHVIAVLALCFSVSQQIANGFGKLKEKAQIRLNTTDTVITGS